MSGPWKRPNRRAAPKPPARGGKRASGPDSGPGGALSRGWARLFARAMKLAAGRVLNPRGKRILAYLKKRSVRAKKMIIVVDSFPHRINDHSTG